MQRSRAKFPAFIVVLVAALICLSGCGDNSTAVAPTMSLAVADTFNNRVLIYNAPFSKDESASVVLGQVDFTSTFAGLGAPPPANGLNLPTAVAKDPAGNLYIADTGNCRVLQFQPPFTNGMNASLVIGQSGFTSGIGPLICSIAPTTVALDSKGNLWVSDMSNSRVLEYVPPFTNGMAAALAIGQTSTTRRAPATREELRPPARFVLPLEYRLTRRGISGLSTGRTLAC